MPDETAVDVDSSSTAVLDVPSVPDTPQEYAEWRMTGKTKPKAESAPAKDSAPPKGDEKGAPASEAGTHRQEPRRSNAETRLQEVLADLKRAGLTPGELKTFKREAQQAANGKTDAKPASSPMPEPAKPQESGLKPPEKPDFKNWPGTWDELEAAKDQYNEKLTDYKVQKALVEDRQRRLQEQQVQELTQKVSEAQKRYGAEAGHTIQGSAQAIFSKDSGVPAVIQAVLDESPIIVDLLYSLGSQEDVAEFVALSKSKPGQALRKIVLMENLVKAELAKASKASKPELEEVERDDSGRFVPPAKPVSKAPPPPAEVSGRSSTPPDEVTSAINANDFTKFRLAQNRRDIAHRKGM